MAEIHWVLPVNCGSLGPAPSLDDTNNDHVDNINVFWDFWPFPSGAPNPSVWLLGRIGFQRPTTNGSGRLDVANAVWQWDQAANGSSIAFGGQLQVGTPFTAAFGGDVSPSAIKVYVKYRVSDPAQFSAAYIGVSDSAMNVEADAITLAAGWQVASFEADPEDFEELDNLRAIVTFQGLTGTAVRSSQCIVQIEWFAFRITY